MNRSVLLAVLSAMFALDSLLSAGELPRVPEGYTVEVAAEAPLVKHPMLATFDERGRLFIAESAGTNRRAEQLVEEPLDFIRVLEDTDGDGIFDKSSIFADKLTFPQGVLCHEGAVYTCAPPYVWKLEDTDGDGVCDKRTVLVKSFGFNGNAASIHGPFLGPDGRLYWCDGRHGHEFFDATGELISKGKAARIFSCLPDGSDVRTFCGGGMDNPVEVDWLPSGEMVGTVNLFYGRPRGDVLVHWVEGGVYPRLDQQDCIDEFTWTGGVLPEIHNYGHVAVSGMCRERWSSPDDAAATSDSGSEPVGSVLVTLFNTHKVVRTTLARQGSTFAAIGHEDLAVWDNPDVHPTDVLEAPDGSILVIDTGGWFRIGCPTSQIAKPEIPGAIYRIRRPGTPVRAEAVAQTATAVPPGPHEARLWLSEGSAPQRLAAAQQVAQVFADATGATELDRRQAAPAVLAALQAGGLDTHLRHALTLALIRIGAVETTRAALQDPSAEVRRAALIALDQMPNANLKETEVIALLDTDDAELLETVLEVISRHEGWVAETVPMFRTWLLAASANRQRIEVMRRFFLAQQEDLWVQELVADALAQPMTIPPIRQMIIDVIATADLDPLPPLWSDGLSVPLGLGGDPDSRQAAMRAIGTLRLEVHDQRLLAIALHPDEPSPARVEAFAAVAPRLSGVPAELFNFLMHELTGAGDLIQKLTAARGLASALLDEQRLMILAGNLPAIGPEVVPILLPAFGQSDREPVGAALVAGLEQLGPALSLSPQELEQLLEHFPDSVRTQAAPLLAQRKAAREAQAGRLEELLEATAGGGDLSRGRSIFFGNAAGCSVCHRVGEEGGQVGPALTNIGAIRQSRDLLESIVFPSASFAREYQPVVVLTDEGLVHSGIVSSTTSQTVTLKSADLKEVRIPRKSIEEMRQSETSIMPAGLETKLSPAELNDLLAYLQSLKGTP
jgi:putative membrane-bound dehydrogenase-like protein